MPNFTQNAQTLPDSIRTLIELIITTVQPSQIVLFGSRARGDHRDNSDFDIAVKGPVDQKKWTQLLIEIDEQALSLYPVDLVLYEELGDDYKRNIQAEGKLIYG
ncbi:MAG: nucleotidyltransferase family protein [Pseudobdellovibrionaceae bacterium]